MKYKKTFIILVLSFLVMFLTNAAAAIAKFNMSYLYFGNPNQYITHINRTNGSLTVVSPNYFDINDQGRLHVNWTLQSLFISEMHRRGIKVVPFLSNHWNKTAGISALNNKETLVEDIAAAIDMYHLDGVNVDIEGVGHEYRNAFTEFVGLLRSKIPSQKEVSVAVAANPNNWKIGWHGFYDYKALSNYANYLMIMAYDESWEAPDSPIGPVASIGFSERSIQYAINQGVPKNKIVIGLPFYGRLWKLDGPTLENQVITGKGISINKVEPLVNQFNGAYQFDEKSQTPFAEFTIPREKSTFLGSTKLTEGKYVVWYENERSIKSKLRLPMKYGIYGTGSWSLSQETKATWDYYMLWLNGRYFNDVPVGFWAEKNIHFVSQEGWMLGTTSTTFAPNSTLTRAQGAAILVRALGKDEIKPKEYKFTDLKGHWARNEIETARELGYLHGKKPTVFGPNDPLTREQLAQIINNIFNYSLEPMADSPFSDVKENRWSYKPIIAIYQQGHITGFNNGTFKPEAYSNRAQMAALMDRMKEDFIRMRDE
ncbi:spore germination protein YaaH [Bacillus oleivorans]|uniref:Spore germination protein YaaH n=1 Tax=Bacillus oleivorans TaxID=1448271 RepID=A0A285CI26_9BACI|nr:glycosyl hydrolase family 18 protein [Bacillus oleivorans]SNX67257.1 spore germination protein YaaH [Bacillus oleivorans]